MQASIRNVEDLWGFGRWLVEFEVALGDKSLSIFAIVKPWIQISCVGLYTLQWFRISLRGMLFENVPLSL